MAYPPSDHNAWNNSDANGTNQEKGITVLLANPNATPTMTQNCGKMVQPTLPPDVAIRLFTGPAQQAPTAIEGHFDAVLSAAASARALVPLQAQHHYDAILVACYSDHPLIKMLREEFDVPVIGIMEASLIYARTLGARFGIIATSGRSKVMHRDAVRAYGMEHFCAGIESCELGVLDLERLPRGEVVRVMKGVARRLVEAGAEVLTLGCAGMSEMKAAVEEAVQDEGVQVIDGVMAGVQHLIGVVRMGGKTSKVGMYRSSAAGRKRRGQEYV